MEYWEWIRSADKNSITEADHYHKACLKYNWSDAVTKYQQFANRIPVDTLREAFWNISIDTESYMSLRHKFITSYAAMCIVHWVFGIGDRHLNNILVSQNTGHVVGIDFGYAFDMTVRNYLIPELIPFRLTPHILNLIEPLGEVGFIEQSMVHCLRALRKSKHLLLSAMEVFINDPSMNWIEIAQTRAKNYNNSLSDDWIPSQKIKNALRKLEGCNPVVITIEELQEGCVRNKNVLKSYLEVVKGNPQFNVRSRMAFDNLTEEEQVKCLLDQAMDRNILGRMYTGFEPWI